jgi:hypothetical protein
MARQEHAFSEHNVIPADTLQPRSDEMSGVDTHF